MKFLIVACGLDEFNAHSFTFCLSLIAHGNQHVLQHRNFTIRLQVLHKCLSNDDLITSVLIFFHSFIMQMHVSVCSLNLIVACKLIGYNVSRSAWFRLYVAVFFSLALSSLFLSHRNENLVRDLHACSC